MRRILAFALASSLVVGACGSEDDQTSPGNGESPTSEGDGPVVVSDDRGAASCEAADAGGMGESAAEDPTVPEPDIEGVELYPGLTHNHVEGCVDYDPNPPVGGDHWNVWQACGFYDEAIQPERGVHSLEHGAVWITYDPALAPADRAVLEDLADEFVLVSPWNRDPLPSPVVASAWGVQLRVDSADDPRLAEFAATYANGPQNREPGAPCVEGGTTETL